MKNFNKIFFGTLSIFAFVIACTDLEEELVSDFTDNLLYQELT